MCLNVYMIAEVSVRQAILWMEFHGNVSRKYLRREAAAF